MADVPARSVPVTVTVWPPAPEPVWGEIELMVGTAKGSEPGGVVKYESSDDQVKTKSLVPKPSRNSMAELPGTEPAPATTSAASGPKRMMSRWPQHPELSVGVQSRLDPPGPSSYIHK